MKSNEDGSAWGVRIKGSAVKTQNCAPLERLCVWAQCVRKDMKMQRARTVRRCGDIIKIDFKTDSVVECGLEQFGSGQGTVGRGVVNKVMNISVE